MKILQYFFYPHLTLFIIVHQYTFQDIDINIKRLYTGKAITGHLITD